MSDVRVKFEREPGYFLGAIYINYAATVGACWPDSSPWITSSICR